MQTILSALSWWARSRPETIALAFGDNRVTYREWFDWIERTADHLAQLGISKGQRVNACGANSLEYCTLAFAAMRVGAIIAPLNARFTPHELCEIVEDHQSSAIFADRDQIEKFENCNVPVFDMASVGAFREGAKVDLPREDDPDACVLIISTSGSTARPKGVMFSNRSMLSYIQATVMEGTAFSDGGGVIVVAPLATSAGMVQLIHYTVLGCSLFMEPVFMASRFLQLLEEKDIKCFAGAPAFFERIAAEPGFAQADLSSLRLVMVGGARVTRDLFDAWKAKGLVIRQTYGQTEAGGNSTIMPAQFAEQFPEKCGWGGIFTSHRIVDSEGNDVAPGEEGQILIKGPGTMLGYWNNPEATAEAIQDGWLHTGDIGKMDELGLITFIDRMKDIIVSGGLNISAAEIERALLDYPGIEECAVIAAPDPKFQETPMAIVYANGSDVDVPAAIQHCNERLADFKVPRYLIVRTEPLPRLATQKLSKPALRQEYREAHLNFPRVR